MKKNGPLPVRYAARLIYLLDIASVRMALCTIGAELFTMSTRITLLNHIENIKKIIAKPVASLHSMQYN